jgi:hypothetical protein
MAAWVDKRYFFLIICILVNSAKIKVVLATSSFSDASWTGLSAPQPLAVIPRLRSRDSRFFRGFLWFRPALELNDQKDLTR